jgi:predicted outer membrane repeat protein
LKAQNVRFIGNTAARNGGGFYSFLNSNPNMVNGLFSGNNANFGGGMYNHLGNAALVNVTFSNNHAVGNGGGLLNSDSSPQITNSIFWENQGWGAPSQIFDSGSSDSVVNYSLVQEWGGGGTGNLNSNPLFADPPGSDGIPGTLDDDLRLLSGSPAIDAGDNDAVLPDYTDLDSDGNFSEATPIDLVGLSRFFDALLSPDTGNGIPPLVDMGAIEAHEYIISLPIILRLFLGP